MYNKTCNYINNEQNTGMSTKEPLKQKIPWSLHLMSTIWKLKFISLKRVKWRLMWLAGLSALGYIVFLFKSRTRFLKCSKGITSFYRRPMQAVILKTEKGNLEIVPQHTDGRYLLWRRLLLNVYTHPHIWQILQSGRPSPSSNGNANNHRVLHP